MPRLGCSLGRRLSRWVPTTGAVLVVLIAATPCPAEQPTATAVATDRAMLPTSNSFGVVNQFRLTAAGDVFFTSGANSGLFRWSQATGTRERLLQTNDPIEVLGLPAEIQDEIRGSLLDVVGSLLQVNAGYAAFWVSAAVKEEREPAGAFVYDGSRLRALDNGPETASQLFVNGNGRAAVAGLAGPLNMGPMRIFVENSSGVTVRVAENFTPAPPAVGGTYNGLQLLGFNNEGQAAFLADIAGGSAPRAVFLTDGSSMSLVVKTGDPVPGASPCTFSLRSGTGNYILNNHSEIVFASDITCAGATPGIWIGSATAAPEKVVRMGEPTGIAGWGNHITGFNLRGFNDSGQVLFNSNISDLPGSPSYALFLKDLSHPTQVVFSRGQSGGSAGNYDTALQATLNGAGNVAFLASLTGGSAPYGWYLGSGTSAPVGIAIQGDGIPLGGTFGLAGRLAAAQLNASNQVLFIADILGLDSVGLFLWTNGSVRTVVSTRSSLPSGANTVLRAVLPAANDAGILFQVLKAGGQVTLYAKPLETGMIGLRRIVAEFDRVPGAGTVVGPGSFSMNGKGELVFTAALLGSDFYPRVGILGSLPGRDVEKAILVGDAAPGGGTFSSLSAPQLNNQTQVAFWANTTAGQGIFVASRGAPTQAVARTTTSWPGGGTFSSFSSSVAFNDSGQVAFRGNGPAGAAGLFVGTGGGSPAKVVVTGEALPVGTVNSVPGSTWKLNALGQVAFFSNLSTGQGIFLGSGGGTPQPVALTGMAAPGAGGATFEFFREESIDLNSSGKVAFWSGLNNTVPTPSSIWQGWFLGSAGASAWPRLLHTQLLPDGGRAAVASPGARVAALANSGEMAIYVSDVAQGTQPRVVIAAVDGTLRKFATNDGPAEGTGSDFAKLYPVLVATPSGKFLFSAMLVEGPAKAGIFVNKP